MSLSNLGVLAHREGDLERAAAAYEESLAVQRAIGNQRGVAGVLVNLAALAAARGSESRAAALYEESVPILRGLGDRQVLAEALCGLARATRVRGDLPSATTLLRESLTLHHDQASRRGVAECLEGAAALALAGGQPERAARLLGSADAIREAIGVPVPPGERTDSDRTGEAAYVELGRDSFESAWSAGRAMTLDSAVAYALAEADVGGVELLPLTGGPPAAASEPSPSGGGTPPAPAPRPPAFPDALSAREVEVLRLLAGGMTNAEIAAALVLSPSTVKRHAENIYAKIGARRRSDATAYALRHGLLEA